MKKCICLILILTVLCSTTACNFQLEHEKVISSLGQYTEKTFYESDGWQDFTYFGIFHFNTVDIAENTYFSPITAADIDRINDFLDDYESWIQVERQNDPGHELVVNYAFDRSLIDTADYFYINLKYPDKPKYNYDIYFLDMQTNTLYFFHSNI